MAELRRFEDVAEAEGWTSREQVELLLEFIKESDALNDLDEYAEERAAADHEDPEEDDAYERAAAKARSKDWT